MIPGVPQVGGTELLILLIIILLFFGAKRVPELGRSLGKSLQEFRKGASREDAGDGASELRENRELPRDEQASPAPAANARSEEPKGSSS